MLVELQTAAPITLSQQPIITFIPDALTLDENQTWTAETVMAQMLVITDDATLEWLHPHPQLIVNSLIITDHASLIFKNTAVISSQNIIIGPNATISVSGIYSGNGKGQDATSLESSGSGAGHAGNGGDTSCCIGGTTYGDIYYPLEPGSIGGATYSSTLFGGAGGGAIHFKVSDHFNIYGQIAVNGADGKTDNNVSSGGGSGGSILISAQNGTFNLYNSGKLSAIGGNSHTGGGGSGGRIAIYATAYNTQGTINVSGGSGNKNGQDGTIYLDQFDLEQSTIEVDPQSTYTSQFAGSTITITILSENGEPIPNQPIELILSEGPNALYGGTQEISNTSTPVGYTNMQGVFTTTLHAITSGIYTLFAYAPPTSLNVAQSITITFTDALINPSTSTLDLTQAVVPANNISHTLATITLYDMNGNLITNKDVHIGSNGTNVTIFPPHPVTDQNGQAKAIIYTADVQTVVLTATVDDQMLTHHPILTFTADALSPLYSTITASPTQATADGEDILTIEAYLKDEQNRPLADRTIQLSAPSVTIQTANPQISTANGRVIFTITSTNVGTQTVYLEDLFTATTLSATVQFVPGTPDKDVSTININPTQLPADGLTTAVVTTIIQDSVGHPLLNETALITSTTNYLTINQPYTQTNAAGIVTATIQSAEIQTATLQALIGLEETPLSQTAVVYFQPTHPDLAASTTDITPTTATANGINTITITGQLTDTFGRPFAHMPLQLTISGQTNTIIPTATQSTNSAGQFSFTLTSTTAETKAITLTDTIYGTEFALGTVEFLPSTVDRAKSTVEYVNPYPVAYANGRETIDLLVTARDANGNPVPNAAVELDITTSAIPNPITVFQPSTTTDANGQLSVALQSDIPTAARIWVIIDSNLIDQFVEVDFALADPHQSTLTVIGNESATADGQELIQLSVTARSTDGTPLPGANVTLTSTAAALGEITLIQPNTPTNANGRTSGYASSTIDGHALVYANIDGIALPTPVTITFKGPDLALQLHAPESLMAGFPLAYELTVKNESGFDATNIVFTETLPAGTVFNTASPAFTYITETHQLVGTLSYLTAGAAATFTSTVQIPHQQTAPATLSVLGTMAEQEANLSNNVTTLTTTITPPAPVLVLETPYPTAAVEQNLTGIISVTLRNDGSLPLTNTTLSLIDTFPWITADTEAFTIPPYGQTHTIALTAAPDASVSPANYLSTAGLSAANYPTQTLTIDVRVQAPTRPLVIYTHNQGNEPITNTLVTIKDTQNIFAPTAVYTHTNTQNTFTNENGFATFLDLESGRTYEVTAAANGYNKMQPLTLILPEGDLPFTQTITLTSIPQLVVEPAEIHLLTQPNQIAQETIALRNVGVTPITSLSIKAPHDTIDFAFLGQAGYLPHLDPGEVISFSFNIAPPLTTSLGVYEDVLQITGDDDLFLEVPVTAYIHDIQDSNLCVVVMSELLNTPLADVTVIVSEESGRGPDSFQQKHTALTDESGQVCFIEIPTGPYKIDVMWNGSLVATKHIELTYEETRPVQVEYIWVTAPSVEVDWTVTPIALTDQYTTTMTLSFIPDGVPSLATSPQRIRLCDEDNGIITETVTIHNFYPVQFTNVRVGLGYLADQGDITAELIDPITLNRVPEGGLLHIGNIAPDADKELLLRAHLTNNNTCSNESGTVFLRTFADYAHYLPNSWYGVEPSADMIPLGETASVPLKLAHTDYPEESNLNSSPLPLENVTLSPPRTLDWMTVSRKLFPVINHEDFVTFTLDVSAPEWLPQGIYRDYILITATNGITAVIGIEAERTAYGLELETRFVTPLNTQSDLPPGGEEELALNYFSGVTQQYGGDTTIRGTTSFVNNTWPLYLSCKT
ncbi:MAG: Ig-like domain-containing protein, partial [Anaerolineales bacterium]|nr:Ig-like domain-containing protein [Anaerolineales bacterium]